MTEGSYRSMSFGEMTDVFTRISAEARTLRPIVDVPVDADPALAAPGVFLAAVGPDEVSTVTTLVPVSSLPIWDVNGYYRAVGIEPPYRPTRRELLWGYMRMGGEANQWATYALKRLLDKGFRAHYDRRPLGEPVDDRYRWEMLARLAALWAAEQSRATGRAVTARDVLGEDIAARMEAEAEAEKLNAEIEVKRADEDAPAADEPYVWPFAYYQWGSRCRDDERLARWQQYLVAEFSRRGLSLQMAVGYFDRTHAAAARVRHRKTEGRFVEILFLHQDADPTPELANVVVATYYKRPYGTPLEHPLYLHHH